MLLPLQSLTPFPKHDKQTKELSEVNGGVDLTLLFLPPLTPHLLFTLFPED